MELELTDNTFAYKGYHSKKAYYANKLKRLVGKGDSKQVELTRRKKLIEHNKRNNNQLLTAKLTKSELDKKLKSVRSNVVTERHNDLSKSIKATGSKYTPGQYTKKALVVAAPLAFVPIPGTSETAIATGAAADYLKLRSLRKNKNVDRSYRSLRKLKKEIALDEKIQRLQVKKANLK